MNLKVSSNLSYSSLHSYMLPWGNTHQNVLQDGYVFHWKLNWERLPIQNVTKRRNIVLWNEHRNTPCVNCFHHSRASDLIPTRAEAKLALPQHAIVRNTLWEVLVNLNIFILVFPMLKKNWPNGAMNSPSEESQNWTFRCRWPTNETIYWTGLEIDFRKWNILCRLESFRGVGIAKYSNRVLVQVR